MRSSLALLPVLLAASTLSPAALAGNNVYMYGLGPRIGTVVIPGGYPASFPTFSAEAAHGETEKIKIAEDTTIEKVRGDLIIGIEALYWANGENRLGATGGFGLGSGYHDAHLILKYDRMSNLDAIDLFVGGGLGVGVGSWVGEADEKLRVPYYPLRGEAGALFRQKTFGIQALIFLNLNIPGRQTLTLADETTYETGFGWAFYPQIGAELQLLFGDFTKPHKKKKGKKKGR
ncbi:MAG: hypothetical protein ABIO70_23530 [Pseudomonadota bacterium]